MFRLVFLPSEGTEMHELIDSPVVDRVFREAGFSLETSISRGRLDLAPAASVVASPRRAAQRWHSTLCDRDLACLLQVIETDLIPQLVGDYSPARHAPLALVGSSG